PPRRGRGPPPRRRRSDRQGGDHLHTAGVVARPRVRGDVGYFAADIAWAAIDAGCDFSLGVTRNKAAWRAAAIDERAWTKARRMRGAQVAVMDYAPRWLATRHDRWSAGGLRAR